MRLDSLLLVKSNEDKDSQWFLYLQRSRNSKCNRPPQIKKIISECLNEKENKQWEKSGFNNCRLFTGRSYTLHGLHEKYYSHDRLSS